MHHRVLVRASQRNLQPLRKAQKQRSHKKYTAVVSQSYLVVPKGNCQGKVAPVSRKSLEA